MMDMDDICMEYDDLVEAGEINPHQVSLSDYMEDKIGTIIDRAMDVYDDRWED
jgi:hypothetical protein